MRDFANEMKAIIEHETQGGDYAAPLVANRIITKLRVHDNELLVGWLDLHAAQILTEAIGTRSRSHRSHVRAVASRSKFAVAAKAYTEHGDTQQLAQFMNTEYVVADGSRRVLANLTHEDLLYVSNEYRKRARSNGFEGAFMAALAAKVPPGDTVSASLTEQEVVYLRKQLTHRELTD